MKKENYTTYLNNEVVNVRYNGKIYVIPKPFNQCDFSDEPTEMETVTNPFSGQSIAMPKFAVAVYDVMQQGLTWFQKYFTDEYYVLLD